MSKIELFPEKNIIGIFKGVSESGTEFAADLIISYTGEGIEQPQMGNFLLVELSSSEQASLGRITKLLSYGRLSSPEGEEYIVRMRERGEEIPKDIKERMMRYRVQVKLLGVLRVNDEIKFTPSQRRLPRLGARVAWPIPEIRKELCKLGGGKTEIGHFVLGEFVHDGKKDVNDEDIHLSPALPVTFDIGNLVAKRTAVFARAGYGKSNLMKYLISELYKEKPETEDKRPVGMLIFDADGEYFWPDSKGRPGLCDVPHLCDKIAVFSLRSDPPEEDYKKWKIGGVKVDIRELKPRDVFSITLTPDRQEQQNVLKLKSVRDNNWRELVNLIKEEGMGADIFKVGRLLGYKADEQIKGAFAEINAAISNVNHVVNLLHDPDSKFLERVVKKLSQGYIVIIDVSLLSAKAGEILAGLLLRKIFSHNQENFLSDYGATGSNKPIPVIAVIEEAQRTLGGRLDETSPFVEWVKEGRKYDLGTVMVTQQPGAIASELLSQVDNWFCFHVLSEGDAGILGKYNSHFSADIRSHMIAEPIIGNCYMWSAPKQPFVLPVRAHEFEAYCKELKADGKKHVPDVPIAEQVEKDEKKEKSEKLPLFRQIIRNTYQENRLKLIDFDNNLKGVRDGQLYYLIKENPKLHGSVHPNNCKRPLMESLFGEIEMRQDSGNYYYCAPKEKWDEILKDK